MDTRSSNMYQERERRQEYRPCCEEKERDSATYKYIGTARQKYCTTLQTVTADKVASQKAYERSVRVYRKKKRLFEWTENNYRLYRNLDICLDNELTAGAAAMTDNVKAYNTLSSDLYNNLKDILAKVKDLKTKISALRDQASNLENFKNDQCNATQWSLLTGRNIETCKGEEPPPPPRGERPEACKDAEQIYDELIHLPKKVLIFDVDSLLQAAADTVGIQTFSNIGILTTQQANFSAAAAAFVKQIQTAMNTRITDLTNVQKDLVTAVTDCTKAGIDEYNKVSIWSGEHHAVEFLCCPVCKCVQARDEHSCPHHPVLEDCECRICKICECVKITYKGGEVRDEDCGC